MSETIATYFNRSQYQLEIDGIEAVLDVLDFNGNEGLSQPFSYDIGFTSPEQDIAAEAVLNRSATFSLQPLAPTLPLAGLDGAALKPLRTLHGVISGFRRLSGSRDEARYQVTLQPRLALLGRGRQYRLYQHQSVPEIVEGILRNRHGFLGQHFLFELVREYPRREQVMQYAESDLAFINRLLAEVGIWYRFTSNDRLHLEVVEFHDDQRHYQFGIELPYRPLAGFNSNGRDGAWDLQANHQVVEQQVNVRSYDPRDAAAGLEGTVDHSRGATTTYGESYRYGEPFTQLGDAYALDEDLLSESGYFYARLKHELHLNGQTQLSGASSSALLVPGQVLAITDGAPLAFGPGTVITHVTVDAARDRSLVTRFKAIPYSETVCFRPPLIDKPRIAGTVPARVCSAREHDPYGHIDLEGRYRVNFLFDRDQWKSGEESAWLRLARPYAGDTHGLHLPLVCGTEVAVAFEQGDPDRPYIAHALHDSRHPDLVTLRNYKRNVLRTPANNKLRMDDSRGEEHIKLSTEHGGKSQLNLGHLVDAGRQQRGEGFELRSDAWGALRAGKGVFISADPQAAAQGKVLAMAAAGARLDAANKQVDQCRMIAEGHHSQPPSHAGLQQLVADATDLQAPAIVLSAPNGIAAVTPASLLVGGGGGLYLQSDEEVDLAAGARLCAHAEQGMSLLARQEGMRLVSGSGPLEIESHADLMALKAQQDITVQSVKGHLQLTALNGITLGCGGAYIRLTAEGEIQIHGPGILSLKGKHRLMPPGSEDFPLPELPGVVCEECLKRAHANAQGFVLREVRP